MVNAICLVQMKERRKREGELGFMATKWRCMICGYVHEGEAPPEVCPLCGVGSEHFEKMEAEEQQDQPEQSEQVKPVQPITTAPVPAPPLDPEQAIIQALYSISYGLYIISAHADGVDNGQCANTCFQVTAEPARIAIGVNKNNYTHELISKSGQFGVSVLNQQGHDYARRFGYRSGRDVNKFEDLPDVHRGQLGILLLDDAVATVEAEVIGQLDAGTHTIFLGEVKSGEVLQKAEPMTYAYFRATK